MAKKRIAFDFDGVICDGLREYFDSAWLAYQDLWRSPIKVDPEVIRPSFNALRPIIETGWEMVLLIHALSLNIPETAIWADWQGITQQLLEANHLTQFQLIDALDQVRDRQIAKHLDHWLNLHQFYDGILISLQRLLDCPEIEVYIITTKEARFTAQILHHQGIVLPQDHIFGKEVKQPKTETLKQLLEPNLDTFWFIEDRLQTLIKIQQDSQLNSIHLFLADWGYNTATERALARQNNIEVVDGHHWQKKVSKLIADIVIPDTDETLCRTIISDDFV